MTQLMKRPGLLVLVVTPWLAAVACDKRSSEAPKTAPPAAAAAAPTPTPPPPPPPPPEPAGIPAPADVAAPPADAEKSVTGLASKVQAKGTGGGHPGPRDRVTVHYT